LYQEAEHADRAPEDAVGCERGGACGARVARASVAHSAAGGKTRTDRAGVRRRPRQQGRGQEDEDDSPDGGTVAWTIYCGSAPEGLLRAPPAAGPGGPRGGHGGRRVVRRAE